ncbi:sporulation protein YtxC [Salipaludibacillus daqingensis]|uniref:sporulation protein YtxC n=1 Tax=Salipaludibacillus daqingensis TaxID=3041001 RepID=UPI002472ED85|nr:sporulation protein YtxC [Salipaludibacillus daqingensis]
MIEFKDSCIGETFYEQLRHSLSILSGQCYERIKVNGDKGNKSYFLSINGIYGGGKEAEHVVTSVLTNTTMTVFFTKWMKDYLKQTFHYEDEQEIQTIMEIAKTLFFPSLSYKKEMVTLNFFHWQEEIYNKISPLIEDNISFSFDSFISFRLQTNKEQILDLVEKAIDEYRMELDYQIMLQKCRDFLYDHEPKVETVYVSMKDSIEFYNEDKQKISFEQVCTWLQAVTPFEKYLPIHERIIGPLVSMAPKKVVIESKECNDDLYHTLRNIFEERIKLTDTLSFDKQTFEKPGL